MCTCTRRLINSVLNSAQLIISFKLFIVAVVLPLPLPLIGTTSLVLGGLTVDPEGGLSLPRPWGGWSWHMSLPPTASRLCWCRSVSRHVVRGSPWVPSWLVASAAGSPQVGGSSPISAQASASEVQPQQPASTATQTVGAGAALPQPTAKETPTLVLPISGLLGIPGPLVAKIREGKFIDLGDLLPEALEWAFERSTEDRKEEGKKKRFPVTSIALFRKFSEHFQPQASQA